MKRLLTAGALVAFAAAALAPQTIASGLVKHRFEAPLQGGVNNAGLELNSYFKKGKPKTVTDLAWFNLSCPAGGYIPYAGAQHWTIDVNRRGKFHETHAVHNGGGAKVTITGKFGRKNGKATLAGTFSLKNVSSCPSGTGTLPYNARK